MGRGARGERARGLGERGERWHDEVRAEPATFERHAAVQHLFGAHVAAAQERPADVLEHLRPLAALQADFAVLPWQPLQAQALVDVGRLDEAAAFIREAEALAAARRYPLLAVRLAHARAQLAIAHHTPAAAIEPLERARGTLQTLEMPYERALIALAYGQLLRREGRRRAASALLLEGAGDVRLAVGPARPAPRRAGAHGLRPATRRALGARLRAADAAGDAVTRLVVSGMTNREVAKELMLSAKTVEFHLRNIYLKGGRALACRVVYPRA